MGWPCAIVPWTSRRLSPFYKKKSFQNLSGSERTLAIHVTFLETERRFDDLPEDHAFRLTNPDDNLVCS